jgi:hypothetical protein
MVAPARGAKCEDLLRLTLPEVTITSQKRCATLTLHQIGSPTEAGDIEFVAPILSRRCFRQSPIVVMSSLTAFDPGSTIASNIAPA